MTGVLIIGAVMMAGLLVYSFLQRGADLADTEENARRFEAALAAETSAVSRTLLKIARPLGVAQVANPPAESPTYRALRLRLAAAGGKYGGFVEVFLATQVAATIVGVGALASVVLLRPGGALLIGGIVGGLAVIAWPYSTVWEAAKKRSALIDSSLPDFAELLLMPLNSGYGVLPALDFAAQRLDGPVADEVRKLLDTIKSRSLDEAAAFEEAGDHLGTSAAKSFFAVLAQAYLEGNRVVDTLNGQAVQLRKTGYERLREAIARMENTIAVMTGIHLLPGLFLIIIYPAMSAIGGI